MGLKEGPDLTHPGVIWEVPGGRRLGLECRAPGLKPWRMTRIWGKAGRGLGGHFSAGGVTRKDAGT